MSTCLCMYAYVCLFVCVCLNAIQHVTFQFVCIFAFMCVFVCVCVCVCVFVGRGGVGVLGAFLIQQTQGLARITFQLPDSERLIN